MGGAAALMAFWASPGGKARANAPLDQGLACNLQANPGRSRANCWGQEQSGAQAAIAAGNHAQGSPLKEPELRKSQKTPQSHR